MQTLVRPAPPAADPVTTARRDLAAALRLAARYGLQEGICNHFSLAIPGMEDRFLINPLGLHWAEMRASDLSVVDRDGKVVEGPVVEPTAFFIHSRIHRAHDHACVMHTHMPYATALTLLDDGRLEPVSQTSLKFHDRIAYDDDYNGLALDNEEGDRMAACMGDKPVIFLANHGVIVTGRTVAEAFDDLYYLERAAQAQVLAGSQGRPLRRVRQDVIELTAGQMMNERLQAAELHFAALKRILDREEPDYAS
jgi:ribulose-5-phosphate 4-epimerase/fuculose-1-phosphate aldolase